MAESLGDRVFACHLLIEGATGRRVTLAEVGEMVGAALEREPYSAGSVLAWEKGVSVPDVRVIAALARACTSVGVEVDPGWLAFGSESYAPAPVGLASALTRPLSVVRSKKARKKGR